MTNQEGYLDEQNPQDNLAISKTEWDLSPLLSGDDDPKIELEQKTIVEDTQRFVEKWKPRTDYLQNPAVL